MNLLDKQLQRHKMQAHQPIPGYWYTNLAGQLQQVRVILCEGRRQKLILLENINGRRQTVDLDGWYRLDLTLHSPGVERRRREQQRGGSS